VCWTAGLRFPAGARDFSLLHSVHTLLGPTQPPIQWVLGALSPGVKQLGHEAGCSPPSGAEVKNGGAVPQHPSYVFMAFEKEIN
jgi:hypothetical protein